MISINTPFDKCESREWKVVKTPFHIPRLSFYLCHLIDRQRTASCLTFFGPTIDFKPFWSYSSQVIGLNGQDMPSISKVKVPEQTDLSQRNRFQGIRIDHP